ncbi:hypothetical protein SNEBB_001598 [Seison nebaliae]|nr:hypothetical protein SNEBB_001598 [Seison nebaliae]
MLRLQILFFISLNSIPAKFKGNHLICFEKSIKTFIGQTNPLEREEFTEREIQLRPFCLQERLVSNFEFEQFVLFTNYTTTAEIFGDSFVTVDAVVHSTKQNLSSFNKIVKQTPWWTSIEGAQWNKPEGIQSSIINRLNHPVVHISLEDGEKYCEWKYPNGGRLPLEFEWEFVCRDGKRNKLFPWGNNERPNGEIRFNIFEGTFPYEHRSQDGYRWTSPVGIFSQTSSGFSDLLGNVWEWTSSIWNNNLPHQFVKRGGSFLCHKSYCYRYRCGARTKSHINTTSSNIGFRCARDYFDDEL